MKKLNNVHYEFTNSYNDKLKEVVANFTLDGVPHRYFIFLQKKGKEKDAYYLKEAKKKFNEDYKSGKVIRSTKFDHSKPILIALTSFFGAAAVALGCFLGHMYATGGFNGGGGGGGGGGDEPEPIVWKDATQEEILTVRDNVVTAHFNKNPFVFLSQLNGTQYKVTHHYDMNGGKMNENEETTTYEIDTNAFYIKKHFVEGTADKTTYITCREYTDTETGFSGYGVYECYDNEETNTKTNNLLYAWPTFDEALKAFTAERWDGVVRDYVRDIYGSSYYEYYDGSHIDELKDGIKQYMLTLSLFFTTVPDVVYQKGNSTSLKFAHEVTEGTASAKFTFDMENSLLKNRYQKVDASIGGESFSFIDEFKTETISFTPDNLDEYFVG